MKILITHGYSDSNKGDLAITLGTYNFLEQKYPNASIRIHVIYNENKGDFSFQNRFKSKAAVSIGTGILPIPYSSKSKSKIKDFLEGIIFLKDVFVLKIVLFSNILGKLVSGLHYRAIQDYKEADLIIVKVGQFIINDKETIREKLYLWRILQPMKVAHLLNKKVIVFGHSFGGFASDKSKVTTAKYLNFSKKIFAREKVSYNFLKAYGLLQKSGIIPDLAFYLKKNYSINEHEISVFPNNHYGVTVVNWTFPESNNPKKAKKDYLDALQEGIEYLYKKHGLTAVFVPQVTVVHHGESDIDIIKTLQERLVLSNTPNIFVNEDFSVGQMMKIYSGCKFLIGTRLHSCILAANVETPIIAIRYQGYKTQGVMDELGLGNMVLDIHKMSAKELITKIESTLENYDTLKKVIKTNTDLFIKQFSEINL